MRMNRTKSGHLVQVVFLFIFPVIFLGMVLLPNTVTAHRVSLFAWVDGKIVHTQSRFAGGRVVKNGNITVFNAQGNRLLSGRTDDQGAFSFELANPYGSRIVLDAGMGHGNEWIISEADGIDSPIGHDHAAADKKNETTPADILGMTAGTEKSDNDKVISLSHDQVKAIVDQSMDNKLKPIMIILSQLQDRSPTITDILGGIGYIVGLVGLGAYIQFRKKNRYDDR